MRAAVLASVLGLAASAYAVGPHGRTDANGFRAAAFDRGTAPKEGADPAGRGASAWEALGPFGGEIHGVAVSPIDPNIVLAGHAPSSGGGALFRSTDGGASWSAVTALNNTSVYDIEFAPDGTAYIGTIDSVRKSTNGGASWTLLNLGIGANDQVFDVTIDPSNAQVLYAGVADALGSQPVNIVKSVDGGTSWSNVTPPMGSPMSCQAIAVDPLNPSQVAAAFGGGFGGGAVWVSTNGGASWTNRSAGLPSNPMNDILFNGSTLLVCGGQLFGSQNVGLYSSANLGASWTAQHDGTWPTRVITDIEVDAAAPSTILLSGAAGVFRTTDAGASWSFGLGGTSSMSLNAVRFSPGSSTDVFIGGNSVGVLRSDDGATTFESATYGMSALDVFSIAANPANPSDMAIAFQGLNNGGVYRTTDGGQNWTLEDLPGTRYNTVGYSPAGVLYAISDGPTTIGQEGLYRRNGDGTWTALGPNQGPQYESELFALAFDPIDPDVILVGGSDFGSTFQFEGTIWRTDNGGSGWTKAYEGTKNFQPVNDIKFIDDGTALSLIAAFSDGGEAPQTGGVLRSTNGGVSWSLSNTGLPAAIQGRQLSAVAGDPLSYFLAGNNSGLYRTTDGGLSWSGTGFVGQAWQVVGDPADAQKVYIAQSFGANKVLASEDGGATFAAFNSGLATAGSARQLALGSDGRLLLAATTGTYGIEIAEPCAGDFNGDGSLDVADFTAFRAAYLAGDMAADYSGNGSLDVADFTAFRNAYLAGCP